MQTTQIMRLSFVVVAAIFIVACMFSCITVARAALDASILAFESQRFPPPMPWLAQIISGHADELANTGRLFSALFGVFFCIGMQQKRSSALAVCAFLGVVVFSGVAIFLGSAVLVLAPQVFVGSAN